MASQAHVIDVNSSALPPRGFSVNEMEDLGDPAVRSRLTPAASKAFFRIMEIWRVQDSQARELLGGISSGAFYALKKNGSPRSFDQDVLTRISLLLGIYKALAVLYSEDLAHEWMSRPNTNAMFGVSTPLEYIVRRGQPGMLFVRQLLDSRIGGR